MRSAAAGARRDELQVVARLRRGERTAGQERGAQFHAPVAARPRPRRQRAAGVEVDLEHRAAVQPRLDRAPHVALAFAAQRAHEPRDRRRAACARRAVRPIVGAGEVGETVAQRAPAMRAPPGRRARARPSHRRRGSSALEPIARVVLALVDDLVHLGRLERRQHAFGNHAPRAR